MVWRATGPILDGSAVESGFELETLRPQSRDLTTRPPRPQHVDVSYKMTKEALLHRDLRRSQLSDNCRKQCQYLQLRWLSTCSATK
ncbi:hypothetical protein AVEN_154958-1 [Araneus ventricosus]|uniref:Uncharacterized protein n=1 Tax=Araneus ventricosus TaxID=182803 RepID=A0A4Y2A7B2_ARAVE|nr:hypothetical protein AVEN_154958-1 [Araneus ventricosus]